MTATTEVRPNVRPQQRGPSLTVLAAVSVGLLVAGLALSAALGGLFPSPYAHADTIRDYFLTQSDAVRAGGILTFASSVPLAIYAATASARLRQLGVTAPGATIALAGGVLSAGALSLAGLLQWTLAQAPVRTEGHLVRALQDLTFMTGGVMHVVFLGLLVAGIAVPGWLAGLLPRPAAYSGLAIAAIAELSTLSLVWQPMSALLPIGRFPALLRLIAAGALLPRKRTR
ncbi:MAG: hypothetical protein QOJ11_3222 [Frankiales bacterium]|jgi:hypothetical protein|nr:hypothetical protein [Frankiales bacterium]